ncbi:MAG: S-methyl-5-thioribose-1-phosphate isomerase [Candidatus Eremiobacteraeota bacterium]|nr:S-methyl-5-thioribose-1-phosphate isomerase [Candidatus Eremiobacteraeota bacterium]
MKQLIWNDKELHILDQRKLPLTEEYLVLTDYRHVMEAIKTLAVRGAPLIGVTASMALVMAAREIREDSLEAFLAALGEAQQALRSTRPTAVNLMWALDRMMQCAEKAPGGPELIKKALLAEALAIWHEDEELCRRIGEAGEALIPDGAGVLTHCNTGSLATAGIGTALGAIRTAVKRGKKIHVYVDETRPLLQGARLTAWELTQDGIPFTLISDNMAGHFMRKGKISLAITGADRIAANGDAANKIGTYTVALLSQAHHIPFYIAAPYSTVDLSIATGDEIRIEERSSEEVTSFGGVTVAPPGARAANPAFDVTPHDLIAAIVTDRGIIEKPFERNLREALMAGNSR